MMSFMAASLRPAGAETQNQTAHDEGQTATTSPVAWTGVAATAPATPRPRRTIQKLGESAETNPPVLNSSLAAPPPASAPLGSQNRRDRSAGYSPAPAALASRAPQ